MRQVTGYSRTFGFENTPGLVVEAVPLEVFFALAFDGHTPQGAVTFHEGFRAAGRPCELARPWRVRSTRRGPTAATFRSARRIVTDFKCDRHASTSTGFRIRIDP